MEEWSALKCSAAQYKWPANGNGKLIIILSVKCLNTSTGTEICHQQRPTTPTNNNVRPWTCVESSFYRRCLVARCLWLGLAAQLPIKWLSAFPRSGRSGTIKMRKRWLPAKYVILANNVSTALHNHNMMSEYCHILICLWQCPCSRLTSTAIYPSIHPPSW